MRRLSTCSAVGSSPIRCGAELGDPGAGAGGVGRQIRRPERADLAVARDPLVRLDRDDRGVEDRDRLAARPLVAPLVERQLDTMGQDPRDAHDAVKYAMDASAPPAVKMEGFEASQRLARQRTDLPNKRATTSYGPISGAHECSRQRIR